MLFNSVEYIIFFVPIVLIIYFFLNKNKLIDVAKCWLVFASLFFYGYITPKYIPILLFSVFFNFALATALTSTTKINKKFLFIFGTVVNLLVLGYFKYTDFFISNVNLIFNTNYNLLHIVLPLGISFFTFQQIAYLSDSYQGKTKEYDFLSYALFIVFFPQLVAGPIVHHSEMMPQFSALRNNFLNWKNLSRGLFLFLVGLFKKVIIADTLAKWATIGFDTNTSLSVLEAWITMLSYTFQIYYDFSGYTDMALGIALMFNIKLPQNFNNPYCAIDIQDFWRRWHMTLSRFLKDYIYIPLGGNRKGKLRTYVNLFLVFLICGFWHGASWLFVLWGAIHGIASIINRLWQKTNIILPKYISWLITFLFVNFAWVLFRAQTLERAGEIYKSALNLNAFSIPKIYGETIQFCPQVSSIQFWDTISLFLAPVLIAVVFIKFFHNIPKNLKTNNFYMTLFVVLFMLCMFKILSPNYTSPFIYFNF